VILPIGDTFEWHKRQRSFQKHFVRRLKTRLDICA